MSVHVLTDGQLADRDAQVRADERRRIIRQANTASGHRREEHGWQPQSAVCAAAGSSRPRTGGSPTSPSVSLAVLRDVLSARPVEAGEALVFGPDGRVGRWSHACAGCVEPGGAVVFLAAVDMASVG